MHAGSTRVIVQDKFLSARKGGTDVCPGPRKTKSVPIPKRSWIGVEHESKVNPNRNSPVVAMRKSNGWPRISACQRPSSALPQDARQTRLISYRAVWPRLTSTPTKLVRSKRRHSGISSASALSANPIGAVQGISRATRRSKHGSVTVRTQIRWRRSMQCLGGREASGRLPPRGGSRLACRGAYCARDKVRLVKLHRTRHARRTNPSALFRTDR